MTSPLSIFLLLVGSGKCTVSASWVTNPIPSQRLRGDQDMSKSRRVSRSSLCAAPVGIFFGTSTGNTQDCAYKIYEAFGSEVAAEPVDIDSIEAGRLSDSLSQHTSLIVGTPTWNTGAETQRSGTGWDDLYYSKLPALQNKLHRKKVAVFGLGDQISYAENYADATGELYDVFNALGCHMVDSAAVSTDGYEHTQSKSILKGSDGTKFCGLLLDQINQEEDTDIRIAAWVLQLVQGGFLDGDSSVSSSTTGVTPVTNVSLVQSVRSVEVLKSDLERGSAVLTEYIAFSSVGGGTFTPHTNPVTGQVLWTSLDGRQSFMTPSTSALRP